MRAPKAGPHDVGIAPQRRFQDRLGYPGYIIPALGLGKVLAILAILWPRMARLKEWAYAGIAFNMIGATISHVACRDPAWSIVVTVAVFAITMASWALRPQSRRP